MMWKIALTFLAALLAVGLGQVPGGVNSINPNDPDFQEAVHFAIDAYNHHSDHQHLYGLVQVVKAQAQVVAGMNYIMTLILGKTRCTKQSDSKNCPIFRGPPEAKFIVCDFTVWSTPWLGIKMKLTGSKCSH